MSDYRKLYFSLMRDVEASLRILIRAQQRCEEMVMAMEEEEEREAQEPALPPTVRPPIQLFPERMPPFASEAGEDSAEDHKGSR